MKDIIHEMCKETPKALFRNNIFLATLLTIATGNHGAAVQTVFLFTFWLM